MNKVFYFVDIVYSIRVFKTEKVYIGDQGGHDFGLPPQFNVYGSFYQKIGVLTNR